MKHMPTYTIHYASTQPVLNADWGDPAWARAETAEVAHFRPEGSDHRPRTQVRLLYDAAGIHGIFRVEDRYVVCRKTTYGDRVCEDSCVEFFARPRPDLGYLNFEFNCGGALHASYITDWTRIGDGFRERVMLSPGEAAQVQVWPVLRPVIDPEIATDTIWTLGFTVPFGLLEHYIGPLGVMQGQAWAGNFYKCADASSHPHWAAWSPVDELNFHLPRCFGTLRFA